MIDNAEIVAENGLTLFLKGRASLGEIYRIF